MGMAVAGMIITSDSGSFPHSLCLAPVSKPFKLILNQYLISQYKRTIVLYLLFYVCMDEIIGYTVYYSIYYLILNIPANIPLIHGQCTKLH